MKSGSKCIFCKQKPKSSPYGLKSYWHCTNCDVAWVKKIPNVEYGDTYYKGKSSLAAKLFSPVGKIFYRIRNMYVGNGQKKVWIDVGAGDGGYLQTVNAKRKIGVEVSLSGRKIMRDASLDTLSDKEFLRVKGLEADIISFWQVLEHVEKPWKYLKAAKRNLKRNGKIVIGIPNIDSFEFKFAREYWFHLQPQFHLWHFTPKSIHKLLKKTGFSINNIDHWSIEHHLTGILQSFINKMSSSKENVLHKLIKRGTGRSPMGLKDVFFSLFWTTIGFPVILSLWIAGAVLNKGGTIVIVAESKTLRN